MNIVVIIKGIHDTSSIVEVGQDGRSVTFSGGSKVINAYDEFAIEEALRIRQKIGGTVKVLSMGDEDSSENLRFALAIGSDTATLLQVPCQGITGRGISIALAAVLKRWEPDLVLAGLKSMDGLGFQVPARIAELMGIGHVSSVVKTEPGRKGIKVVRDLDEGRSVWEMDYPALITVQKGINTPRYPTVMGLLQARKKEIEILTVDKFMLDTDFLRPRVEVESMSVFNPSRKKKILEGDLDSIACALVSIFRGEEQNP